MSILPLMVVLLWHPLGVPQGAEGLARIIHTTHHRQHIRRDHYTKNEQTRKEKEENSQTLGTADILNGDSLRARADRRLHHLDWSVAGKRETPKRVDMTCRGEMAGH